MIEPQDDATELEPERRGAFVQSLVKKRDEAISGRVGSGIETDWLEDEEHYQGIDDANRAYARSWIGNIKRGAAGAASKPDASRSTVFLNITRPYVDAAAARVADMLLPTDDKCWAIKPTPIPEIQQSIMATMEDAQAQIEEARAIALEASKAMEDEINDCLVESNWHGEVRSLIEDSARVGSGVLKGPYPIKRKAKLYQRSPEGNTVLMQVSEIKPGSKRIDPWNFYPDPACGESIHNGSYTFERDFITSKQLRDMMDMPHVDAAEVIACLREGPQRLSGIERGDNRFRQSDDQFESWIFYGVCDADDLEAAGVPLEDETPKASAMAVLVNDRLIKCTLNVLDTGEFPYDVLAWQRRPGMPWGSGVSRQGRTAQRMVNAAIRATMDNAALTAAPQIVIGNGITPADGSYEIRGRKLWRAEADVPDVRAAFMAYIPPSVQPQLMAIVDFGLKMMEDTTGMPAMLQGQQGAAPDTVGGMQMLQNNASSVMRRLAKRFDDYITEPHIRRYYDWQMQHSEDNAIKGDFQVDVRASSALVERDAQQQFLMQMAAMAPNPVYGIDPAKLFAELCKGQRLDPKNFQYPPDQIEAMRSQSSPVDQAKAGLLAAQTKVAEQDAVVKGATALFSSTQVANLVASNPMIAQSADQVARSVGFQDQDAAPIIAPVNAPAEYLPHNTSPMFPAHPDTGINSGIEAQ